MMILSYPYRRHLELLDRGYSAASSAGAEPAGTAIRKGAPCVGVAMLPRSFDPAVERSGSRTAGTAVVEATASETPLRSNSTLERK